MGRSQRHPRHRRGPAADAPGPGPDLKPRPSPNIWHTPEVYEVENRATDPHGRIVAAMQEIGDWSGRTMLDVGCGTGFHLPLWAESATQVIGVEPHPPLVSLARRRTKRLRNVTVVKGMAESLPVRDASVDVVHARWAYFFGPGSEPGLRELDRVVRRGGTAFVIDNDPTRSTFGGWFGRGYPEVDAAAVERFWSSHGWSRRQIDMGWAFTSREALEAVVRIELPPAVAEQALAEHAGTEVDYAVNLWWRHY